MPNHVHLLIQTKEPNLSEAMKSVFEIYAFYFNKKYSRKGHVFCGRFRACLCNSDAYFLASSVYINLNPVRAGLSEKAQEYPWCSATIYLKGLRSKTVNSSKILGLLSTDMNTALKQYSKLMETALLMRPKIKSSKLAFKQMMSEEIDLAQGVLTGRSPEVVAHEYRQKSSEVRSWVKFERNAQARAYIISQLVANGHAPEEIQQRLGISRATYFRFIGKRAG
jgi:putative transposase